MSARAFLCSFSPKPSVPSDVSAHGRSFGSDIRIRVHGSPERAYRLLSAASAKRRDGRVWADVKSKGYEVAKVKEALNDVVEGSADSGGAWWEEFPKRWVIVVLCFTAFLLCNMDRVSS